MNVDVATLMGGRICEGLRLGVGESGTTTVPFLKQKQKKKLLKFNNNKIYAYKYLKYSRP